MEATPKYSMEEADRLDKTNELSKLRDRFYIPHDKIYMDWNSLCLLSRDAERSLSRGIDEWKNPWY